MPHNLGTTEVDIAHLSPVTFGGTHIKCQAHFTRSGYQQWKTCICCWWPVICSVVLERWDCNRWWQPAGVYTKSHRCSPCRSVGADLFTRPHETSVGEGPRHYHKCQPSCRSTRWHHAFLNLHVAFLTFAAQFLCKMIANKQVIAQSSPITNHFGTKGDCDCGKAKQDFWRFSALAPRLVVKSQITNRTKRTKKRKIQIQRWLAETDDAGIILATHKQEK